MTITSPNAPAFLTAAADTRRCMRCLKGMKRIEVISKSKTKKKGSYSMLAQVMSDGTLTGGMLCKKCEESFREWMEKENKNDD